MNMTSITTRYLKIIEEIRSTCLIAGRDPEEVKLIVVTKRQPVQKIIEVCSAGANLLGENYPEEAERKILEIGNAVKPNWHMIGHIQSRKIKIVVQYFSCVHSIDRIEVAQKLDAECRKRDLIMPIFVEVNIGGEESKFGFPVYSKPQIESLFKTCEILNTFNNLKLTGLMTMPPLLNNSNNRRIFSECRLLQENIRNSVGIQTFSELSMGTSQDFREAIKEGATFIRIGEAIMGERTQTANEYL